MNERDDNKLRNFVDVGISDVLYCDKCGKVMTILPNTIVCLNKKCTNAGILISHKSKRSSEEGRDAKS